MRPGSFTSRGVTSRVVTSRVVTSKIVALTLALAIAAPQLLEARYKPSTGMNAFSRDQEVQAGQQAAAEVARKLPLLPDSDPIARYVSRLGQTLASHAPGDQWPYSFHVVNQKDINAFALPGGPVYINLGTIQAADNEAQLAGVIAHEISHIVQRHATRAATKQMQAQIPLAILGAVLGGRGSMGGQLAQLGISFGLGSYFLKNSRTAEREADLVGADIMYDSGYDPRQLAAFFETLQSQSGSSRGPQFLSDHPDPGNRAASIGDEVRTLPARSFQRDSTEFQNMKRLAMNMRPMTAQEIAQQQRSGNPNGGYGGYGGQTSRPDVMASGNFRSLQHQAFTISYPDNWQVFGDDSSSVTIAPPAGVAQNAVAYGVIIDGFQPESERGSLDDAMHQLLQQLHQSNPDLRAVGNDESIRVNGVTGRSIDLVSTSAMRDRQGRAQRERDWLVAFPYSDNTILYLVFIAPEQDFETLRAQAFEPMLRSLRLQQQ
ncbi:MAG: M48 family metallopeptidase [Acidobacteriota bacterium]|nr:M48 family metallopeptidase [Acidobacteriota bacterium]